ncbi:right-handed parallel beta-helix repeat-containing protein [Aquisphaera insulae]|uniref:right-handed parallel beta-helix repeat-containing protein n=1 Tax=Aquisphaera insulae TaxID=2712864 RepID=UPI0013EAA8A0|nr:right-handed parallel beta-helix repeat-containing protein [Aquisphaera insulae]
MKPIILPAIAVAWIAPLAAAAEIHVSTQGNDAHSGSPTAPFRTIGRAAEAAMPGDVVVVHAGTYRERVNPPRGGESDARRITYQAAPGEAVEIKGSEAVSGWTKDRDQDGGLVWKVTLPGSFFGAFNPFAEVLRGDWFDPRGRVHHAGAVYLNGDWLVEARSRDDLRKPPAPGGPSLWFAEVADGRTTIRAQFPGIDPNHHLVEVNVRRTVFYPDRPGRDYITVRGFTLKHAAAPWAPPTAEQVGIIGPHWSRGWIIEGNRISHSTCSGVSLGKYGDRWDNTSADTAEGYVKTIERALGRGWNMETVGHHVVRDNEISHCEQTGIVGSLGAIGSTIRGNSIHDIHVRKLFTGAEMAGIKLHAAIDVQILHNQVARTCLGIWLDWMAQGTRVAGNLLHDNEEDLFLEVDHGPFLVDDNVFLSPRSLATVSRGGAFVHNLFGGTMNIVAYDARKTPFHPAHSTALAGLHDNPCGDDRYFNNVFTARADLTPYDAARLPVAMAGNLFLNGSKPSAHEENPLVKPDVNPAPRLVAKDGHLFLVLALDPGLLSDLRTAPVTAGRLGKALIPNLPYEQPDGSPVRMDLDYLGALRTSPHPTPGPFEALGRGTTPIKVW